MYILGIETSCDETAASVVKDGKSILSNVVATSLKEHSKYGGIIPEIASRRQIELISAVVQKSLEDAGIALSDIDALAVTQSPGLIGSLLVGVSYARALSFALRKPLVNVDHIQAHLYANFLTPLKPASPKNPRPKLPAIGLVVSGGHSSLFELRDFTEFKLLGQTRDDAAGEAFDKVARILGLGYPGGPVIDRLAKKGVNNGIRFQSAELPGTFDFSFSGIKTAVLYYQKNNQGKPDYRVEKIAYAFQKSVVEILVKKSIEACKKKNVRTLLMGGGVAANSYLREKALQEAKAVKIQAFFPPLVLCLDNAAMIAGLGYHRLLEKKSNKVNALGRISRYHKHNRKKAISRPSSALSRNN